MRSFIFLAVLVVLSPATQADENWPDFRGPTLQGHADAPALPLTWSEEENITWKTPLPGKGWSSPVIWEGQIWMTTAIDEGHALYAICVDQLSGEILHNIKIFDVEEPVHLNELNSHASPSAVIEESRVYVHFGTYGTACLDSNTGEIIWQRRDLNIKHMMGPGSSPILFEDMIIVHCDGADVQYVISLNKQTGETVWRTDRSFDFSQLDPDVRKAYSTPIVIEREGESILLSSGAQAAMAYDAHSGEELWQVNYDGYSNVSRPVVGDDIVYLNTGFVRAQILAVRLGGSGNISDSHIDWRYDRGVPRMPSSILLDDLFYMVDDRGVATCIDIKTGEAVWNERLGGDFSASLLAAAGRIYYFDREGKTTVTTPGRTFEQVAENLLEDGCMASPAVSGNTLFLRTRSAIYRIEE